MIPKPSDVGVLVGRWQVHQLHEAHLSLIRSVYDTHPTTIAVIGLSPARLSVRNPLDFEARKQMLLASFPKLTVLYIKDERSDAVWSAKLDALIEDVVPPHRSVRLYGGRDSFVQHYFGRYPVMELDPPIYVSGTELRKTIHRSVKASEDFRAGVIWATANGYPKVFPTVDIAVRRADGALLLVKKEHEEGWRFPGGFVQPTDVSYEMAARREVQEETGVAIDGLRYVTTQQIDDWRYRNEDDKIVTTLYEATYISGAVQPADDVSKAAWVHDPDESALVPEHRSLLTALRHAGGRHAVR